MVLSKHLSRFRADALFFCALAAATTTLPLIAGGACLIALFAAVHMWLKAHSLVPPARFKHAAGAVICAELSGILLTFAFELHGAHSFLLGLFAAAFFVKSAERASIHMNDALASVPVSTKNA